jgi:hypothetical protein
MGEKTAMTYGTGYNQRKPLRRVAAVYKEGAFSKPIDILISVYDSSVSGFGLGVYHDPEKNKESLVQYSFDYKMEDISDIRLVPFKKQTALELDAQDGGKYGDRPKTLIFPNLADAAELAAFITKEREHYINWKAEQARLMVVEQEKERQLQEEQRQFFENVYDFHIKAANRPFYTFHNEGLHFAVLYVGADKSLNFLVIDGVRQQETNGVILYPDIHYYEKAGTIHYTTEIQASSSSFGGSFVTGSVSAGAAILGGLLLGPMGMAAGAMLTHTQTAYTAPTFNLDISSTTNKIDDRSVILNHYSAAHNLFIDIELPADIYNFLQTHLSEKKYDIVIELEKQSAVKQLKTGVALPAASGVALPSSEPAASAVKDSMEDFKLKVEKLMFMKTSGLISQEEFEEEKKRLLKSL